MNQISRIDLNADLGESYGRWQLGDDTALLEWVTSANIACGFHAGDPSVIATACERAARRGVAIGAQVGYHDLPGFGRRFIDMSPRELANDVVYQLGALDGMARIAGSRVSYVRPHGALYNAIVHHEAQAAAVVEAVRRYDRTLPVLGLPGSAWLRLAEQAGLATVPEAFADRGYAADGTLAPRDEPGAVLTDPVQIAHRCVQLARGEGITAINGERFDVRARSVCVHGDGVQAPRIARAIRGALADAGICVLPFTAPASVPSMLADACVSARPGG